MFSGLNEEGELVFIEDAVKNEKYFCPVCNKKLIQKRGDVKVHHFAHESISECDSFYEPMTEWHLDWQKRFPKEYREVVMREDGVLHRADIFTGKYVVEVQHSSLSSDKIRERCKFYNKEGRELIWLFDRRDKSDISNWSSWYYGDIVSPVYTGICNTEDKSMKTLICMGIKEVAFDCGEYILFCYNMEKFDTINGDRVEYDSLVMSKDIFTEGIIKDKLGKYMSGDIFMYDEDTRPILTCMYNYCDKIFADYRVRGVSYDRKAMTSISRMLSNVGLYTIKTVDRNGKVGYKDAHLPGYRNDKMFVKYLANCEVSKDASDWNPLLNKLKYNSPQVVKITLGLVCREIINRRYLEPK